MFDLTSSKLLILGIVALLVVGPKDLPMLLRTIGKYMGMIRRQAAEFRSQFDEAMRESELDQIRKDVETLGRETEGTLRDAESSLNKEMTSVEQDVKSALDTAVPDPIASDVHYDGHSAGDSPVHSAGTNGHEPAKPADTPDLSPVATVDAAATPAVKSGS